MNKTGKFLFAAALGFLSLTTNAGNDEHTLRIIQKRIVEDNTMKEVNRMAHETVSTGLNAGDGYGEVWIRDYNTFIEVAMDVTNDSIIRNALNTFFHF